MAADSQGNTLAGESYTWVSAHPEVASVSDGGMVTAVASGTTTITATTSGIQDSAAITVATAPDVLWHLTTGTSHTCGGVIRPDGVLYTCGSDGNLYAINPEGSVEWMYDTGDPFQISPTLGADGTVYVGTEGGELHAVNPDGTEKWNVRRGGDTRFILATGLDGALYSGWNGVDFSIPHGTWPTSLKAFSPDDGTLMWTSDEFPSGTPNSTPTIAADGTIYLSSCGQWLNAFNPDGTTKWRSSIADDWEHEWPPWRQCEPSIIALSADGTIYLSAASTVNIPELPGTGLWRNRFYAFNPDGSMKWTLPVEAPSAAAIGLDGTVFLSSADGVYAIAEGG